MINGRKKFIRIALAAGLVSASAVLGSNCGQFAADSFPSFGASTLSPDAGGPEMTVALLSSEQILKTMISAAGIENLGDVTTPEDDLIQRTFDERSGSLPSGQELSLVTGPGLISVTNIAAAVCEKAVNRDIATGEAQRAERLFFREFDFSQGISAQDSESVALAFERLARNAWRRDVSNAEIDAIITFAQEFSLEADTSRPADTKQLAVSICTAVFSSIDALTY